MIDCLIIGFNDFNFVEHERLVRMMGTDSGAYRDLQLAFIRYEDRPYRSMDILNRFYFEGKRNAVGRFSNTDFLWPVVLYLGSYLNKHGFSFDYVNLFHLEKEKLKEKLTKEEVLTVAITTTLYVTAHPILEIISFIRQHNEKVKIVVGGPYIHNQPGMLDQASLQQQFNYMGADYYVISQEGEAALVNLLGALKAGASLDQVNNIAYRQGGGYVLTPSVIESNPLEENPIDYRLFPREDIDQFISLRTAKSCPFSCSFCGFPQRAGKYKYTGVELVEHELNRLAELGVGTLTFLDDTFNVPKARFRELLEMMIHNKYGFKWNSFYRSDHGNEETIELMARAGCEGVFLGVESGSDEMLERMNKTSRRKNYLEAIPMLQAVGISAHANLIVGFPGETYETVQDSISLIEETKPDFFRAQLWYADPMTPIWERREQYGVQGSSFHWSHNTMDYRTACDLVDRMFFAVENSTWLPQNGFEQWSIFYLQRKGMTMSQVKTFVRCFNAAVKDQLIHPHQKEIDANLIESLKASCRFDTLDRPNTGPIEFRSAAAYKAAESFWVEEFGEGAMASNLESLSGGTNGAEDNHAILPCRIDPKLLQRVRGIGGQGLAQVVLAAYSTLLSRLSGREGTNILTSFSDAEAERVIPIYLEVPWGLGFRSHVERIGEKLKRAAEHRHYALSILTNPWRMASLGAVPPVFDVGYYYHEGNRNGSRSVLREALETYPEVKRGINLALRVGDGGGDGELAFSFKQSRLSAEVVGRLGTYLESLLEEVSASPDLALGDFTLAGESNVITQTFTVDAAEEFNF